ncbi:MAG TPA: hypothetical protein PK147_10610 [Saprospiraceae bacterium]|nr:hypothetical protein [Saprospiraceae bacterium]MCB9328378.1 hypothetical protein [Lewinellaceae bacterium]HPK10551.1 hypothetical protein [Saprospiraceae bacterium]HPQ22295.1 hypothetical protein [Saprospiraceae bacterium]HRX28395.1 hypothetical protein [Saprospiraceae bacterium]
MKIVINIILLALICLFSYWLVNSISEPIRFQEVKSKRAIVVQNKLKKIRTAEEIYRTITGEYAGSFDTLSLVLKRDSIPFVKLISDPDDPTNGDKFTKIVTYSAAIDSIKRLGINLDSLRYVPFAPANTTFDIAADTMTYQSTLVNVVEVGTPWKTFMGDYGDPRFKKYDAFYDPNKMLKFGDLNKPSVAGNWE